MSEKWTDDQLSAINTTDKAVIVSAAAGSGKTAVLVERTIRLLVDEKKQIPADKLLAVTFTNDAASQMREKLNNALNLKIEEDPTNEWLQLQQMKLQNSKIATINAFCLDLVKNNIHNFDISSGVRILDETENAVILSNAIESVMEKYYATNSEMMTMLNDVFCDGDDKKLTEIILQLYNFSRSLPFKDSWFDHVLNSYSFDSSYYNEWIQLVYGKLDSQFKITNNSVIEAYKISKNLQYHSKVKEIIENDVDTINIMGNLLNGKKWDKTVEFFSGISWIRFSGKADKNAPEDAEIESAQVEYIKNLRAGYKKDIEDISKNFTYSEMQIKNDLIQNKQVLEALIKIVNNLWDELWGQKVAKNAIDFADVEILSIQLLAEESENGYKKTQLAKDIVNGNDYKIILIDEFQDVNNLQDIIFKMLSDSDDDKVIGENMFVVGDIKQSIYRFRQANPNIFIQTRKDAQLENTKNKITEIKLKKNFRSRKCVIDFVNFIFDKIMTKDIGEVDYDCDEELDLGANFDERELDTEILVINTSTDLDEKLETEDVAILEEPLVVAKKIKQMIDEGYPVYENESLRPCRQGDFCVLLRSKTVNKEYIEAFKKMGLQAQCEELTGYLRSREISLLINMLNVIDNPMNDIALASVLLSPIFMFSADELAQIRNAKPYSKLYPVIIAIIGEEFNGTIEKIDLKNFSLEEKCKVVVGKIRELRFYSSSFTLERLITKIYDSTDFFSLASTFKDSTQKRANLRLLLEYANSYDKSISGGLTGFIRYINSIFKNGGDLKQAGTINNTNDSVAIKTIHKSKGLEYPFVFLCRTSTKFSMQKKDLSKQMLINLYSGIGFRFKNPKNLTKYTTLPYDAIRIVNEKEMLSEEMRLLYVALTRAKEKIFITYLMNETFEKKITNIGISIGGAGGIVPSIVKSANSMQDWITMALLTYKGDDYIRQHYHSEVEIPLYDSDAKINFTTSNETEISDNELVATETKVTSMNFLPSEKIIDEINHYINFKYDFSFSQTTSKLSVSEIAKKDDSIDFFYQLPKLHEGKGTLSAAEKGTATHAFMELANYDNARKDVNSEIQRLVSIGLLSKKQGQAINKKSIQVFFEGDFFSRMRESQNIMREKQFIVMISQLGIDDEELKEYNDTDGMLQGIADCIFEEDDGYVLVDYKTDNVKTVDELTEHYTLQLKLYKLAFELILDKPIKSSYIYSFKLEKGIEVIF